jgi:carbamoyl-phosphate synthase large subunit
MIKVLFTGGGGAGNEAIWRLLNHRYELHFADADIKNISPIIPENRRHRIPLANNLFFTAKIKLLCQEFNIDLVIPGVDEELQQLANDIDYLLPTIFLMPDIEYIETTLDKYSMIDVLFRNGIKVPPTEFLNVNLNLEYPCIAKPRLGRGSRDVYILNDVIEAKELCDWMGLDASHMLIQDKIEGTEYTVQMIADSQAKLKAIVPVKIDIKRGITIRAMTDNNLNVIEACRKIHEIIPAKGCYNIQLILTKDGEVYPFEINPRISTTFCMTVAAGIDPIDIYLNGNNSSHLLPFEEIQLQRHWTNYFTENI